MVSGPANAERLLESSVPGSTVDELLLTAATQPIRVLTTEATEEPRFSAQRLRCKILTINRHQMASRWIDTLKGKEHLRLVSGPSAPPGASPIPPGEQA